VWVRRFCGEGFLRICEDGKPEKSQGQQHGGRYQCILSNETCVLLLALMLVEVMRR